MFIVTEYAALRVLSKTFADKLITYFFIMLKFFIIENLKNLV